MGTAKNRPGEARQLYLQGAKVLEGEHQKLVDRIVSRWRGINTLKRAAKMGSTDAHLYLGRYFAQAWLGCRRPTGAFKDSKIQSDYRRLFRSAQSHLEIAASAVDFPEKDEAAYQLGVLYDGLKLRQKASGYNSEYRKLPNYYDLGRDLVWRAAKAGHAKANDYLQEYYPNFYDAKDRHVGVDRGNREPEFGQKPIAPPPVQIEPSHGESRSASNDATFAKRPLPSVGTLDEELAKLDAMIGLAAVKSSVRELVDYIEIARQRQDAGMKNEQLNLHLVFSGNPGTGKTTVARSIGAIYRAMGLLESGHVVEVSRKDLVGTYIGDTAPQTDRAIQAALGGVLFVDEAYALSVPESPKDYGAEAITTILLGMENHREELAVIVAGYSAPMEKFVASNPGLRSRFPRVIEFEDYNARELVEIFESMAKAADYDLDSGGRRALEQRFEAICADPPPDFGNGRDVRNFFEKAVRAHAGRLRGSKQSRPSELRTLRAADFEIL